MFSGEGIEDGTEWDALAVLLVKCYCEKELQSEDTIDDLSSKPVQSCQSRTSHRSLPGSQPEL